MFKSRRSGLVRRLWRSRLVTESSDGGRLRRDGSSRGGDGGRRTGPGGGRQSGERHRLTGELPERSAESGLEREEEEQQPEEDRGAMCVPEHRGSQEDDSRTVTCCWFGDLDLRHRGSYWASRKDGACLQEEELASTAHAFLKRLKERSLDALVQAVESRGGIPSDCVMVPGSELRLGSSSHHHHIIISPQSLLVKLFRWRDLPLSARLKTLSHCQSSGAEDGDKVCCNPYHYSRLCGPESPPPPYSLSRSDEHKPLDSTLSYTETVPPLPSSPPHITPRDYTDTGTSIGSSTSSRHRSHWCSVAYWEQRTRVGRLYPAYEPSLNIFYDLPQGTGLCLGQLHANAYHSRRDDPGSHGTSGLHGHHGHGSGGSSSSSSSSSSGVQQIRSKIGHGIVLSREPDGVWVYNRSQHPVFVHSPTLDPPRARGLSVKRVMPGFSLKVFDYERSSWMAEHGVKPECQEGPWDPHSVRISFAKGWGPCYSRQFITSCPCWLEVLLNNHR